MKPGQKALFRIRDTNNKVMELEGKVLSVDGVTLDGHQVIEVEFVDGIRKYSAQHL
jgi:hypothetical protein